MTNKQVKILANKAKQIEDNINQLTTKLTERSNYLCRNDPLYQAIITKLEMEKVRLNDMSEFTMMMEKSKDEQPRPGTSSKVDKIKTRKTPTKQVE